MNSTQDIINGKMNWSEDKEKLEAKCALKWPWNTVY